MTRQELTDYIFDEYSVEPDYPFPMDDVTCVFRHIDNRKWFGIAMVVPYRTIGINRDGNIDILNVKCDPIMMGTLRGKSGFCPAYHIVDYHPAGWISKERRYHGIAGRELSFDSYKSQETEPS